jgi:alcohol dehydrogenase (cytochrome c)
LISATPFARKINWASGIDMASGRPIDTPMTTMVKKTEEMSDFVEVWPSAFGGKNWMPMSFDPKSGLVFLNSIDLGMKVKYVKQQRPGGPNWYLGLELGGFVGPEDGNRGALVAWDPGGRQGRLARAQQVAVLVGRSQHRRRRWSSQARRAASSSPFDAKTGRSSGPFQTGSGSPAADHLGDATDASTSPSSAAPPPSTARSRATPT